MSAEDTTSALVLFRLKSSLQQTAFSFDGAITTTGNTAGSRETGVHRRKTGNPASGDSRGGTKGHEKGPGLVARPRFKDAWW